MKFINFKVKKEEIHSKEKYQKKKNKKKNVKNYLLLYGTPNKANKDNINIKIGYPVF